MTDPRIRLPRERQDGHERATYKGWKIIRVPAMFGWFAEREDEALRAATLHGLFEQIDEVADANA